MERDPASRLLLTLGKDERRRLDVSLKLSLNDHLVARSNVRREHDTFPHDKNSFLVTRFQHVRFHHHLPRLSRLRARRKSWLRIGDLPLRNDVGLWQARQTATACRCGCLNLWASFPTRD